MRDYIDMALEEQEDEETREDSPLIEMVPAHAGHLRLGGQKGEENSPEKVQGGTGRSGREALMPGGKRGDGFLPVTRQSPRLEGENPQPLAGKRLQGTALPEGRRDVKAYEGAAGLERRLQHTRAAAGYRGNTLREETRPAFSAATGNDYLALDAAAERDARRYDGGFELF